MQLLSRIKRNLLLYNFRKKWRKQNFHNETTVKNIFPIETVRVGKRTYGTLEVYTWGEKEQGLKIGSYVSIANGVKFLLGGNHRMDTFSTFPFKAKFIGEKIDSLSKGEIVIEDDVWLGMDSIILSGAYVGKGAVIGAGTVVSGKIPSYAVVVGNPGKIIKYRFDKEIIEQIKEIKFDDISDNVIKENLDLLYQPLTKKNLEIILKKLN